METSKIELSIPELLHQLICLGFKISYENDDLLLKGPPGKKIEASLLNEITVKKQTILEYLKLLNVQKQLRYTNSYFSGNIIKYDEKYYHRITPIQNYWVDDKIDKDYKENQKSHGQVIIKQEILGKVDIGLLRLSIERLLERHESLRATFHKIRDDYVMGINDIHNNDYIEYREFLFPNDDLCKAFVAFKDHKIKFEDKVFLVRIAKKRKNEYVLSMKLHHVIFDSWSREILFRDLVKIYSALEKNIEPDLPILKYQYKDFLSISNDYRKVEYQRNKEYWNRLFPNLPNELIIPGAIAIKTPIEEKTCRFLSLKLSQYNNKKLNRASGRFNCSRFIIIQALFYLYIFNKTGQSDIIIGTFVFGREMEDSQHQIGCFAKTVLLRIIINEVDSLENIISKVIRANEDMNNYRAFTLIESMLEKIGSDASLRGTYWKINLLYNETVGILNSSLRNTDTHMEFFNNLIVRDLPLEIEPNYIIPIDMQLDFQVMKNDIFLKVEYDSSLYSKESIEEFISNYIEFITQTDF